MSGNSFMSFFVTAYTDSYGDILYEPTAAGFTALVLIMAAVLLIGCAIFGGGRRFSARQLSFSAMAIALATVTSMIKLVHMPMGGSVTLLSMLFIALIGYWYGLKAGLTTAIAYGILQLIIDPYILSFAQMLIDYIFAFGALGLSGIFAKRKSKYSLILSYLTAVLGRYVFAFISGWIFFGMYAAGYGFNSKIVFSLAYNGAYLGPEALLTVIILALPPISRALAYVKDIAREGSSR